MLIIDSLFTKQLIKQDLFKGKNFLISYHELGNNSFKPILLCLLDGRLEGHQLLKNIEKLLTEKGDLTFTRYNQARLFSFQPKSSKSKPFFYTCHKGVFIISSTEMLVQDAIRQAESDVGLLQKAQFVKLQETAGDHTDANIYLQFSEFRNLLSKTIDLKHLTKSGINRYAEWGALDLNIKNNTLLLNGFSNSEDKTAQISKVFQGQSPQNIKFINHIANTPEAFTIIGISDAKLFRQKLADYMEDIGQKDRFDVNEQLVRKTFGNQSVNELETLTENEIALVTLADGSSLFAMQTSGYRDANELIKKLFESYCKSTNTSISDYKRKYKIDNDSEFQIYKMPIKKLPTRLFGPWFNNCKAEYVGVFDDYIIFSDTYKSLTKFIYNNVLQKTIAYNGSYKKFENFLSSKVNFYQFISLSGTGKYLERLLTPTAYKHFNLNQEEIREFYGVAMQFSVDNNMIYNSLLFRHQPSNTLQASTEWESRLDTSMSFKPVLIRNHYSNEKEIFIQDLNKTIYLLNKSGRILWKKKLEEKVLGQVHQVDYFKNGKLQILFNTKSKLHLVDRNGNYVERFPVSLPEKATAPLAIFDYEKRKNYRIFIPCKNNKVYAYNIEGKIVTGFNFSGADYEVNKPVQYFRNSNKDYIIVTDKQRTYILDRKGKERAVLKRKFTPSINNQYTLQLASGNRKARLVTTDNLGKVQYVYFDGRVESQEFSTFSENHFFSLQDINSDGIEEFIFIEDKKLIAFNSQSKKMFDYKFQSQINQAPSFYKFSSKNIGIGITESGTNKIYLLNSKGKVTEGFPLKGKTRFSIGVLTPGSGRFNLLVGGDDFYLYNYKLN